MLAKRQYDPETKAAVMAALLTGQSVGALAAEYQIPAATIRSWKARGSGIAGVDQEKKIEIGDLLMAYLRANLAALEAQAEVFADPVWLKKQPASEAAVLHGVMADKAVRLLEAFGRNDSDTDAAN